MNEEDDDHEDGLAVRIAGRVISAFLVGVVLVWLAIEVWLVIDQIWGGV